MRTVPPNLLMYMMGFCNVVSFSSLTPILAVYVRESIGASIAYVGIVASAFFFAAASTKLTLATLTGGKRTLQVFVLSSLIFALSPVAYALSGDISTLIVLRIIHGIAFTFVMPSAVTLTSLSVPEADRGIGTYSVATGIGFIMGPAASTFGTAVFGVRNTFYLSAIFGLIGFVIAAALVWKMYSVESRWLLFERNRVSIDFRVKLSRIFKNKVFVLASIGEFPLFFLFGVMFTYGPLYGKEVLGLSNELVGTLFLTYYAFSIVAQIALVRLIRRPNLRKEDLLLLGLLILTVLSLAMAFAEIPLIFAVAFSLAGIGNGIVNPVGLMMVAKAVGPSDLVLANAALMMFFDLGGALAPITTSPIATMGMQYTFLASSLVMISVLVTLAYLRAGVK